MSASKSNRRPSRNVAVPAIVGSLKDFLVIGGLAGTAKDIENIEPGADNAFLLGGAMGAAVSMGIGLAVMQPKRHVLVVTGDGELLMNVGALATVTAAGIRNLSIVCVDNELYGETGNQTTHTAMGVDLAMVARGFGIPNAMTVLGPDQFEEARAFIRRQDGPNFVHLRVSEEASTKGPSRSWDAVERKLAFRKALLGHY